MKKALALILASLILLALGTVYANEAEVKTIDVFYLVDSMNNDTQLMLNFIEDYCDEFCKENPAYKVVFTVYDANLNVDRQINDIETAVASGAEAIIISCVDAVGLRTAAEVAADQGVVVVDVRNMGSDNENVIYVNGSDEVSRASLNKEYIKNYLDANPDAVLNAGLMGGAASQVACLPRVEVIATLADEYPGRFNVLVTKYTDWTADNAISLTEDWLQTYPDLNCIVCANEALAQGTVAVLNTADRIDEFLLLAFGGEAQGLTMIHNGEIDCIAGVNRKNLSQCQIRVALDAVVNGYRGTYDAGMQNLRAITLDNYQAVADEMGVTFG